MVLWDIAFRQDKALVNHLHNQIQPTIIDLGGEDRLVAMLRNIRLLGDPSVKIYKNATISLTKFNTKNLNPLARYALESQLAQHKKLFWFLNQFGQNLFDLKGMVAYKQSGKNYCLVPPIIETYVEPTTGKQVSAIIDGLHRTLAARQLGLDEMWVVEVTNLPVLLPPIALPVQWEEVNIVKDVPPTADKRFYRYASLLDYPDLGAITTQKVTLKNYQYFLYRDFSPLGSDGIRTAAS